MYVSRKIMNWLCSTWLMENLAFGVRWTGSESQLYHFPSQVRLGKSLTAFRHNLFVSFPLWLRWTECDSSYPWFITYSHHYPIILQRFIHIVAYRWYILNCCMISHYVNQYMDHWYMSEFKTSSVGKGEIQLKRAKK